MRYCSDRVLGSRVEVDGRADKRSADDLSGCRSSCVLLCVRETDPRDGLRVCRCRPRSGHRDIEGSESIDSPIHGPPRARSIQSSLTHCYPTYGKGKAWSRTLRDTRLCVRAGRRQTVAARRRDRPPARRARRAVRSLPDARRGFRSQKSDDGWLALGRSDICRHFLSSSPPFQPAVSNFRLPTSGL